MTRARILADYVSSGDELALKAPLISPALVTPNLGTPSAGVMTNMTGAVTASLVDDAVTGAKIENNPTIAGNLTVSGDFVPSTPLSHRNYIINGDFQVWQRGEADFVGNAAGDNITYGADRWEIARENQTTSKEVATPVGNVRCNSMRMTKTGGGAITAYHHTEDGPVLAGTDNGSRFNGKTLTLSFYAKANTSIVNSGQIWLYHASTSTQVATTTDTFTTSWVKYTHTFTMPTNTETYTTPIKKLTCSVVRALDGAVGDADWIEIAQVQLEEGSNATPFEHRTYGDELLRCLRYYNVIGSGIRAVGSSYGTTGIAFSYYLSTQMRDTPTLVQINSASHRVFKASGYSASTTNCTISNLRGDIVQLNAPGHSGLTDNSMYVFYMDGSYKIGLSSEL
jgi:hypothetical protein